MGCVETSVRGLLESKGAPMNVIEEDVKKKKGAKYVNSGNYLSILCIFLSLSLYLILTHHLLSYNNRYFTM
jgi:hypothetical protein